MDAFFSGKALRDLLDELAMSATSRTSSSFERLFKSQEHLQSSVRLAGPLVRPASPREPRTPRYR